MAAEVGTEEFRLLAVEAGLDSAPRDVRSSGWRFGRWAAPAAFLLVAGLASAAVVVRRPDLTRGTVESAQKLYRRPVDPGYGVDPPVDPEYGVDPPVDPDYGVDPPVDPEYGVDPHHPVDPGFGVDPHRPVWRPGRPVDPDYGVNPGVVHHTHFVTVVHHDKVPVYHGDAYHGSYHQDGYHQDGYHYSSYPGYHHHTYVYHHTNSYWHGANFWWIVFCAILLILAGVGLYYFCKPPK